MWDVYVYPWSNMYSRSIGLQSIWISAMDHRWPPHSRMTQTETANTKKSQLLFAESTFNTRIQQRDHGRHSTGVKQSCCFLTVSLIVPLTSRCLLWSQQAHIHTHTLAETHNRRTNTRVNRLQHAHIYSAVYKHKTLKCKYTQGD